MRFKSNNTFPCENNCRLVFYTLYCYDVYRFVKQNVVLVINNKNYVYETQSMRWPLVWRLGLRCADDGIQTGQFPCGEHSKWHPVD